MQQQEICACNISRWYNQFKEITVPTVVLPMPVDCIQWILQDGIIVDDSSRAVPTRFEDDYGSDWSHESDAEEAENQRSLPPCPRFLKDVDEAINRLGGKVFPKLGWSCPKDAEWMMTTRNLCCTNGDEIMLLLKSSDRVLHDLSHTEVGKACRDSGHVLALRKWYEMHPMGEFRCFVAHNKVVAVSQRETSEFFPGLKEQYTTLGSLLVDFHVKRISSNFPLEKYVFDCYIEDVEHALKDSSKVTLVDFNPWGGTTSPLLFGWEELEALPHDGASSVEVRCVMSEIGVRPNKVLYGVPFDFVDTCQVAAVGNLAQRMVDLEG